jgi:hypothetical protein
MKSDYSIRLAAVTLFTMLAPLVVAGQDGHARHKRCTQFLRAYGTLGPSASTFGP